MVSNPLPIPLLLVCNLLIIKHTLVSATNVKIQITYSVNGEAPKTVDVTIDNGSVKAGNLYRLYIGMKVKNNEIKTEVVCYTKDWIKENINIEIKD